MTGRSSLRLAALCGLLAALLVWAPASWLAAALERESGGRLLWRDAAGSWHDGSVRLLLAVPGSPAPPQLLGGRLHWRMALAGLLHAQLPLRLQWDGVAAQALQLSLSWRDGGWLLQQQSPQTWNGQWPAQTLAGLGAPWNTLAPRGLLRLSLSGLRLRSGTGGARLDGRAELALDDVASRLSPLPKLGSYALLLRGDAAGVALRLDTRHGPLLLQGDGHWGRDGLHFSGSARAEAGAGDALDALLALLGPRQGDAVALRL